MTEGNLHKQCAGIVGYMCEIVILIRSLLAMAAYRFE